MADGPKVGKKYRVIQWGIGNVGTLALRHFAGNPVYEVVGVLCSRPEKVGKDAGELVGVAPIGVLATTDKSALEALEADCVFYAPLWSDIEEICRLLRGGKNVVASGGAWWYRTETNAQDIDKIEEACQAGRTSFHAGGIHPGFAADLLVLTLCRIVSRIDRIHIYEYVNFNKDTLKYLDEMGFGKEPAEFEAGNLFAAAWPLFAQSLTMVVDGVDKSVERFTTEVKVGLATRDIPYEGTEDMDMPGLKGVIKKGTVAAQQHEWTAWVDGKPFITLHETYSFVEHDAIDPRPDWDGYYHYRLVVEGEQPTELILRGVADEQGDHGNPGYTWTAMGPVNTIPAVCDAPPGFLTHKELGLVTLRGVVR
ncbi:dihydrodipicolinate reductase [Mycobacterium intermedium]|uniref:Dihydrodipicolinate reductase n=1 Tax=Mycobacterium intermedium TaxID=28445 RepID=A0A1E3SC54_MYCIE|nr:dihydrodipicolinate reductase [Mycobacterium intermedium]ODQ99651.1 dihydrodipicolinate reductase [Mycobacterium intermedium]OPE49373.1 dihydrodipicolinate reductase [Mycobacterium intermedium]ORB09520.1 dihydrodipicolinate reductase [Mycobacterium intermedium]